MALPALKDLVLDEALTKPLALPLSGGPAGPVSIADYAKALPEFEQLSRGRIAHFISSRTKLAIDIKNILSSSPELLADVLLHIDGLVEVVSKVIDDQKARLEAGRIETDRKIAQAASANGNAASSLRELQTRLLKAEADFINALVDYYYFLLALRAEHDPDARGGPSFDNPDDLAAYLRERSRSAVNDAEAQVFHLAPADQRALAEALDSPPKPAPADPARARGASPPHHPDAMTKNFVIARRPSGHDRQALRLLEIENRESNDLVVLISPALRHAIQKELQLERPSKQ